MVDDTETSAHVPLCPRLWVVTNSSSGTADTETVVAKLRERYGEFSLVVPEKAEDFENLDQPLEAAIRSAEPPDVVVAAGGDGTVSAVASALWRVGTRLDQPATLPKFGVVPMGTANVLAREFGFPLEFDPLVEQLSSGQAQALDVIEYRDRALLCRFSIGDLASPGARTSSDQKQRLGAFAYTLNAVTEIVDPKLYRFEIELDGERFEVEASSLVLTNLTSTGLGDLRWGPSISAHDGAADLLIVRATRWFDNISMVWSSVLENEQDQTKLEHRRVAERIVIRAPEGTAAVADGEVVEGDTHTFCVRPSALQLLVPPVVEVPA